MNYVMQKYSKDSIYSLNVIFTTREDAMRVLEGMIDIANYSEDHTASVYDFLSLSLIPDEHEELTKKLKWSIVSLRMSTKIVRNDEGYSIDFPKEVILDAFDKKE